MTTGDDTWDPYTSGCPSRDLLDRIGDKWSVLILGQLSDGEPRRYARIRNGIAGISEKMLTQTLRHLEEDGLVTRDIFPEVPPRVEYGLTPLGQTLRTTLTALREWSVAHASEVLEARGRYAADIRAVRIVHAKQA
ncbi:MULTISPECIES: helix-turn-helix domain-containing protein [unclassified Frondihabitans]|uniref:winged helix-turn-helix transcriptional regulator n=1 Tax=unclassified Frondihabitans TaxID=2626248 RepID=UPI000F506734|nr:MULTISPECIES: helix-turn-helix domain-containing protein [unclassified Frondihabitans]RPE77812.1 HxlR family transcriptional regulator [Frondihabitans sp. PhB153]RPF08091.1 HxlR family transcriptional regulator [Frondihabitans sp. PhB161]